MIVNDACAINNINDTSKSANDASWSVTDNSRVTLQMAASLLQWNSAFFELSIFMEGSM
jgi:hypothetical protein